MARTGRPAILVEQDKARAVRRVEEYMAAAVPVEALGLPELEHVKALKRFARKARLRTGDLEAWLGAVRNKS